MSDKIKLNGQNGKGHEWRDTNWHKFRSGYERIFRLKPVKKTARAKR